MVESLSRSALNALFGHNYWARDRQLEVCRSLSEDAFLRPMGSSFASLRDTLAHMVAVEWIWLERWRGHPTAGLQKPSDFPSLASITARWATVEEEMRGYLAGLDQDTLAAPVTYVNIKGETWSYPLWQLMLHLLQHQAYHRGQVATLLRQHGVQPPAVDFLVGLDAQNRSRG